MIKKRSERVEETRENMRGGNGKVIIRHYFKKDEIKAACRLCAELVLPPASSIGLHEHVGEDEVFIIQQGTGVISDGVGNREVEAGDAILTGDGASHSIKNIGRKDLLITAVIIQY